MKKILIVTSSYYFMRTFLIPHIQYLRSKGWEVHVASDNDGDDVPYAHCKIDIPIRRSPFSLDNIKAIKMLKQHIDTERYNIVHCHTPLGAMVARLAAQEARKKLGTKVIYMTHGLHYYKGAPLKNWILYYPAERYLSRYTDAIITINEEDRASVAQFKHIKKQYKIPGIGYNSAHIEPLGLYSRSELRAKHGFSDNDFICIYIARYTNDKNHRFLIRSLSEIHKHIPQCKILLLGDGEEMDVCRELACKLQVDDAIRAVGFQPNITDYLQIADVGVSPSVSEGLGLGLVEEMYAKLPVIATDIRGHRDLITHGVNGLLYHLNDKNSFIEQLLYLYNNPAAREMLGNVARENISQYAVENIIPIMMSIYNDVMVGE